MHDLWQTIECQNRHALAGETSAGRGAVLISTRSEPGATRNAAPHAEQLSADSQALLREAVRVLRFGALLFIYGAPRELALWGRSAERLATADARLLFKYWIALDLDPACRDGFLQPAHRGLLLFQKVSAHRKTRPPFPLQAAAARVPHQSCAACGRTLKDWGGKRHLMHPQGAALSDVWRDLSPQHLADSVAPAAVLQRLAALTPDAAGQRLHLLQTAATLSSRSVPEPPDLVLTADTAVPAPPLRLRKLERNRVYHADCVAFLERVARLYPEGIFDMVFADPPYNLEKNYAAYADDLAERHYLAWCEHWLAGMARTLKPGGSLFVLNLPRWAMYHAAFLHAHLTFRHWIAWDALSEPRGRLMPAHYALLYYTKPGGKPVFNYRGVGRAIKEGDAGDAVTPPDAPQYCLRAGCLRDRKARGDDARVELSDVWFDVHRIKHKRDRDAHPCQLPEKLMERLIRLTTRPGDLVFDPFCGAGTTAIAARKLGRDFVVVDLDADYVRLTREKLVAMARGQAASGVAAVPRARVARPRKAVSKRDVELALQQLARDLGRAPTEADLSPELLRQIALRYPYPGAALKRARIGLSP
jgi:site-specific DNA-methyltransferase (adenine-specific)